MVIWRNSRLSFVRFWGAGVASNQASHTAWRVVFAFALLVASNFTIFAASNLAFYLLNIGDWEYSVVRTFAAALEKTQPRRIRPGFATELTPFVVHISIDS